MSSLLISHPEVELLRIYKEKAKISSQRKVSKLSFSGSVFACVSVWGGSVTFKEVFSMRRMVYYFMGLYEPATPESTLSFVRAIAISFLLIMSVSQVMANYETDEI